MKKETEDITLQNTTQEKKAKTEVISIKYFYDIFPKKYKRKISLLQFKKIVKSFLKIYFYELYFNKRPMYFFLGGMMKVVTYEPWSRYQYNGGTKKVEFHDREKSLGLFWYLVPSLKIYYKVKLRKLTGSTNMIPKIEKVFNKNNDKDLLPIFTEEKKKGNDQKTLYRCIQD